MRQTIKLLIIEDQQPWMDAIRTGLEDSLNDLGFAISIHAAATAQEAVRLIRDATSSPYDLVSLDIHLEESSDTHSDGIKLLRSLYLQSSAWMVSILTGVERDSNFQGTVGQERAELIQTELRSIAYATFPPDRLLVTEKPELNSDLLNDRLKQICSVFAQSLSSRNIFRAVTLPCRVAMVERTDGTFIRASDKKLVKKEREASRLVTVGKGKKQRLPPAQWFDDQVHLRQVRFGCGEIITLPDFEPFKTIEWILKRPHHEYAHSQVCNDAVVTEHSDADRRGAEMEHGTGNPDADPTDKETRESYQKEIRQREAHLVEIGDRNAVEKKRLELEIKSFKEQMETLRTGVSSGLSGSLVSQHKTRTISTLKEAGQVEFAEHLEQFIKLEKGKVSYDPNPSVFWNT